VHLVQELEQGMQNFVKKKLGPKLVSLAHCQTLGIGLWFWADSSRNEPGLNWKPKELLDLTGKW